MKIDGSAVGAVLLPNDAQYLKLGASQDFNLQHNGVDSGIENMTGHLYISNYANDKDIIFRSDDGSGGLTAYLTLDGGLGYTVAQKRIRFNDDVLASFGDGQDMYIYHDATDTNITNQNGDLYIQNIADDKDIRFRSDDGSGGVTEYFRVDGSSVRTHYSKDIGLADSTNLYLGAGDDLRLVHLSGSNYVYGYNGPLYIGSVTTDQDIFFRINDNGADLSAIHIDGSDVGSVLLPNDNQNFYMGASNDFRIVHNGTDTYLNNYTGDYIIGNFADDKDISFRTDDGSGGQTEYFRFDGSSGYAIASKLIRYEDSVKAMFGTGGDFAIQHDGSNTYMTNSVTGHLYIQQGVDDKDIVLQSDDGSGGVTAYLTLDGGLGYMTAQQHLNFVDMKQLVLGTGNDLRIYHDSGDSVNYIESSTSDMDIKIKVNDGGSTITAMSIDASAVGNVSLPNDNQGLHIGASSDLQLSDTIHLVDILMPFRLMEVILGLQYLITM